MYRFQENYLGLYKCQFRQTYCIKTYFLHRTSGNEYSLCKRNLLNFK